MLFATLIDASILPFYAFCALAAETRHSKWEIVLANKSLTAPLTKTVFYLAIAGGGLFLISLAISIYLVVVFRKITQMPPDYNPLEDNLTSRSKHKHKSSTMTTSTMSSSQTASETQNNMRETSSRPNSIPFFETRVNLPERNYQIHSESPRSSVDQKRHSMYSLSSTSPSKHSSFYHEVPLGDLGSPHSKRQQNRGSQGWYTADSLSNKRMRPTSTRKNGVYHAIETEDEPSLFTSDISDWARDGDSSPPAPVNKSTSDHINPLGGNPPTPRGSAIHPSARQETRITPLGEISSNKKSIDLGDRSGMGYEIERPTSKHQEFKAKFYGELKPGTPPLLVGANRQVSSGTDFPRRDVSGKIAEEGRGGNASRAWGARLRKVSGM